MALPDHIRTFLVGLHFATIATIDPDGRARQAVIWYLLDGDEFLINSRVGRRWPTNLLRDPRISVSVMDETDPLRWVGLNGTAEVAAEGDAAQLDIAEMARKYEEPTEAEQSIRAFHRMERITFRVRFDALHDHLD
ncbi:MAG TPA: TIGR03618 family F420-dependent PPOX class oxidoreductase [Clostridia bacterium]|nr:TIGR03618 family F420-dependent PPOX class oxidoreductase [Clostridia bacterium]